MLTAVPLVLALLCQPDETTNVESFDGLSLACEEHGSGHASLVFVHGWCCNRGHWKSQVEAFSPDYRVVALDLGGHGESGTGREHWSLEGLGKDVVAVLESLDLDEVVLIGHSMGGPVSLIAAAQAPDRVVAVVGVDTLHDASLVFPRAAFEANAAALETDAPAFLRDFVRGAFPPGTDEKLIERVTGEAGRTDARVAAELMRAFGSLDAKQVLAACPVPVVCINATKPFATNVEENRRYAPSFDVALMEGVGHFPMLEKPAEFNRLLREQLEKLLAE